MIFFLQWIAKFNVRFEFNYLTGWNLELIADVRNDRRSIDCKRKARINLKTFVIWGNLNLQVDGAAWRDNKIVQNIQESNSPSLIKNFTITYGIGSAVRDKQIVDIPLYSNSTRNALICTLQVCTASSTETVILAGVALIVPDWDWNVVRNGCMDVSFFVVMNNIICSWNIFLFSHLLLMERKWNVRGTEIR